MNKKISLDPRLDLLVSDLKTEEDFAIILNFLEHTASVIRYLQWDKKCKNQEKKQ